MSNVYFKETKRRAAKQTALAKKRKRFRPQIRLQRRFTHNKVHNFKQTYFLSANSITITAGSAAAYDAAHGTLTGPGTTATTDLLYSMWFQLADLPQQATYAALFDCYRINKVVVKMVPTVNNISQSPVGGNQAGTVQFMSTVEDYDDNNAPGSYAALLEYENFYESPPYKNHKRVIVPAISQLAFKTSGTTIAYTQRYKQWVDIAYTDVPHFGIKGSVQKANTAANSTQQIWKIFVTMYVSFKQVR